MFLQNDYFSMCSFFHIQEFFYIINPRTKKYEYLDPSLFNMTYERFVMNVKDTPKIKVKYELIIKSKNLVRRS